PGGGAEQDRRPGRGRRPGHGGLPLGVGQGVGVGRPLAPDDQVGRGAGGGGAGVSVVRPWLAKTFSVVCPWASPCPPRSPAWTTTTSRGRPDGAGAAGAGSRAPSSPTTSNGSPARAAHLRRPAGALTNRARSQKATARLTATITAARPNPP